MTEEDRLLLNDLRANIQQFFREYNNLETEKKLLEEKLEAHKKEVELLKQEIFQMGQRQENLKIANRMLSGKDENGLARKKINKLVREIDKCIALLNK